MGVVTSGYEIRSNRPHQSIQHRKIGSLRQFCTKQSNLREVIAKYDQIYVLGNLMYSRSLYEFRRFLLETMIKEKYAMLKTMAHKKSLAKIYYTRIPSCARGWGIRV